MEAYLDQLAQYLFSPVHDFIVNANERYYWLYMVIGLAIAWAVYSYRDGRGSFFRQLLERKVWWSTSARNDYAILFLNPAVGFILLSWAIFNSETIAGHVATRLGTLGLAGDAGTQWQISLGAALTVLLFVVGDFVHWFVHYLHHRIPVLWELHKVHHSAEVLNFATAERIHPLEALVTTIVLALTLGLVNGVFIALFGDQLSVMTMAGANVLWIGANLIGGVLRHSPFWVSFGPRIERWLISPAMHQIHHSEDTKHFDRNFGSTLAIWDRLAGTIYIPKGREDITYGIGEETREFRPLSALYLRPLVNIWRLLASGWRGAAQSRLNTPTRRR